MDDKNWDACRDEAVDRRHAKRDSMARNADAMMTAGKARYRRMMQ
ncbi:hypothetical protein [Pseudoxanthomonas sp. SE1]|jgi:hypothetical protein|nr:hypothetical protein [Pseudoxanthomonas sp. SE1]WFC41638.1 hypothetical protein OY559_17970 [Pseudoxanthomonas sp. SE1]